MSFQNDISGYRGSVSDFTEKPRETCEYMRGTQIPLNKLEGLLDIFHELGDISGKYIEVIE